MPQPLSILKCLVIYKSRPKSDPSKPDTLNDPKEPEAWDCKRAGNIAPSSEDKPEFVPDPPLFMYTLDVEEELAEEEDDDGEPPPPSTT